MDDLMAKIVEVDARAKSNTKRIDDLDERQKNLDKIVGSIDVLANEQSHIKTDVTEIKSDVKALTQAPIKQYEKWESAAIGIIVGAIITLILKTIGLV